MIHLIISLRIKMSTLKTYIIKIVKSIENESEKLKVIKCTKKNLNKTNQIKSNF